MIDNFEQIINLLDFSENNDDFYFVQIIRRKKENEQVKTKDNVVKSYYITNTEYLLRKKEEMISLCECFNARAYINLNKRSFKAIALELNKKLADILYEGNYINARTAYDSACGSFTGTKNRTWIVDIDTKEDTFIKQIKLILNQCEPIDNNVSKVLAEVPTKHGLHLISKPFNLAKFKSLCTTNKWSTEENENERLRKMAEEMDIHKNNMTLLYCI